jgi:ArsR family transcriptional regulator
MDTSMVLEAMAVETTDPAVVSGFAALADPTRLAILQVLSAAPRCVCDVNDAVPVATNVLSYHLKVLRDAGLVSATRRGRWVDYRLVPEACDLLRAAVPRPLADAAKTSGETTA